VDLGGVVAGDVFLDGYGDPTVEREDIEEIAQQVHAAGVRQIRGSVVGNGTAFEAPGPFDPEVGGVPGALVYDRGRAVDGGPFQPDPALAAAARLDDALEALGVTIAGVPRAGAAPAGLGLLASVAGPSSREVATRMNKPSDNFVAEMVTMALGARTGETGTRAGGVATITRSVARMGARASLVDGTGLSVRDRAAPGEVVDLLRSARRMTGFQDSLPVAGREGTVEDRMRGTKGRCSVKTGTIRGARVSALSGFCRRHVFSILVQGAPAARSQRVQDAVARLLARK
jgi:D-alanyl-D-alanine carboxypeptidase/D-alanyl-D-alanine-endopeptidase (penicillin-binding protein 4)